MSRVRESVEWGFGNILNLWQAIEFKRKQQIFKMPVGAIFQVATILTNLYTCLYPERSNVCECFGLLPPKVEDYLKVY